MGHIGYMVHALRNPLDTGQNIPEGVQTLRIQQQQLLDGTRHTQMFPKGTKELPLPHGIARFENRRGVFHYNPKVLTPDVIDTFSSLGRENELLGLGPYSKPEIMARVANGEKPVVITEHTSDGIEVRSVAGTDKTAVHQLAYLERTKGNPSNTITFDIPSRLSGTRK